MPTTAPSKSPNTLAHTPNLRASIGHLAFVDGGCTGVFGVLGVLCGFGGWWVGVFGVDGGDEQPQLAS